MRREVGLAEGHHLVRSFEKIVTSWANFEDVIEDNITYAIEISGQETNPAVLVRVLRVIERQHRVDKWWRQSALVESERLEALRKKGIEPAAVPGSQSGYRPKQLRERALEWMQTGVEKRFQSLVCCAGYAFAFNPAMLIESAINGTIVRFLQRLPRLQMI
eukprot:SAG31_NODE_12205_length_959_cov_0.995349_2_plen_161_part_00